MADVELSYYQVLKELESVLRPAGPGHFTGAGEANAILQMVLYPCADESEEELEK